MSHHLSLSGTIASFSSSNFAGLPEQASTDIVRVLETIEEKSSMASLLMPDLVKLKVILGYWHSELTRKLIVTEMEISGLFGTYAAVAERTLISSGRAKPTAAEVESAVNTMQVAIEKNKRKADLAAATRFLESILEALKNDVIVQMSVSERLEQQSS